MKTQSGNSFDSILSKYVLLPTKLIVAVSGGPDSMALFHIIKSFLMRNKFDNNITIVHFNHNIRKESDGEEKFLKKYFEDYNFVSSKYTGKLRTESVLRKARYAFFKKIYSEQGADFLVLGHHLNDRIESTFLHMMRGCSLKGFLNMNIVSSHIEMNIFRPLLSTTKQELITYCDKNKIPYFIDQTNFDSKVSKRNLLRNQILPQLLEVSNQSKNTKNLFLESRKNIFESLENKTVKKSKNVFIPIKMSKYWEAERSYKSGKQKAESKNGTNGEHQINTEIILNFLHQHNSANNLSQKNLNEICDFLGAKSSGHKFLNGVHFFITHGEVVIIKAPQGFWEKKLELSKKITRLGRVSFGDFEVQIDDKNLIGGLIRFPKEGDVLKGKRLKKYLLNEKIPIFWRNFVPVIEKDSKLSLAINPKKDLFLQ